MARLDGVASATTDHLQRGRAVKAARERPAGPELREKIAPATRRSRGLNITKVGKVAGCG